MIKKKQNVAWMWHVACGMDVAWMWHVCNKCGMDLAFPSKQKILYVGI
jgi:hypothetical protein